MVQICFRAASCSSTRFPRVAGSVPWLRISSRFHPTPTPNATRPPDTRSRLATSFAVWMTSRCGNSTMPVPSTSRDVTAATADSATNGSSVR